MKFYFAVAGLNPDFYLSIAQKLENAGFDGIMLGDSIIFPQHSDSEYPYNTDGSRQFIENLPFFDPLAVIPAMAAVTGTLKYRTTVYKLPLRNPVLAAKSVSSVAVLSKNRLELGVGTGPWPEDFKASDHFGVWNRATTTATAVSSINLTPLKYALCQTNPYRC